MSKMSELDAAIRDLQTAVAAVNKAVDALVEMYGGNAHEAPSHSPEPLPSKEEVRAILTGLSTRGFTDQVRELLRKHGAPTLSGIDPSEYRALIRDAEELGNG